MDRACITVGFELGNLIKQGDDDLQGASYSFTMTQAMGPVIVATQGSSLKGVHGTVLELDGTRRHGTCSYDTDNASSQYNHQIGQLLVSEQRKTTNQGGKIFLRESSLGG
jgi:hypothetical protein